LEAHDRWVAWSGSPLGRAEGMLAWAAYHRTVGDARMAVRCAQEARVLAANPRQPLVLLTAHRILGELATETGRHDEAARHLAEALTLADACTAPYERALTLLACAALARARHDAAAAVLLDEAVAICTPLDAKPALLRATSLGARIGEARPAPPRSPAGLTAREVEVLRLVAAGCTNEEIAATLGVSIKTVINHVTHILTKTNLSNRTAAAAFAVAHGLH
jgi:DNA-binding CsgD family transcriptional regulator